MGILAHVQIINFIHEPCIGSHENINEHLLPECKKKYQHLLSK